MKKYLISIIIVNWEGEKFLRDCISSLLNLKTHHLIEIIVVDNGSKDGSVKYLKSQSASWRTKLKTRKIDLIILENKENVGFARANNQGFDKAKGDFILFLNNDTKVSSAFLDPLVDVVVKDPKIAGVQPKIVSMEDHSVLDSSGSFFTSTGILFHRGHKQNAGNPEFNKEGEIFSMKGACMLFRTGILKKVGVFDEDYFAYFEETDLCHRIWIAGYKIIYVPKSVIYHKGGGSTYKVGQAFIQYHSFKNRIASYLTNFEVATLFWLLPIHISLCFAVSFGFLATKRFYHFLAVYKALFWNIVHIKSTLVKRRFVQKDVRKVSDNMYLGNISKNVRPIYYWFLLAGGLEKYE